MNKELFKEFLTSAIEEKKNLLVANSISDEDKEMIQAQITNLEGIVEKVDALEENETTTELIDELKSTVNDLSEKLTALNERINQQKEENNNEEEIENKMEYLKTKNAVADFATAIRNSRNAEEFRANWGEFLVKNEVTETISIAEGSEEAFLPEIVKGLISDAWDKNADWLRDLNNTGAKRFYVRHNTSDQTDETSRAKGHKKGTEKAAQELELAAKLLEGQFIYKIAEISYQTEFDDEGLVTYVVSELVDQILYEIKRAILVGDGRLSNDPYKINSFEAIAKDTTDAYTVVSTATADFLVDDMRAMVDGIHNPNGKPIYVFMSKADLRTLARVQASETSTPVYMSTEQVAEQIGANRIITTDLLGSDYKAVAMIPSEYYMVGRNILNPEFYSWHEGYKNLDVYRYECVAGGGINGLKSTAVLKAE